MCSNVSAREEADLVGKIFHTHTLFAHFRLAFG